MRRLMIAAAAVLFCSPLFAQTSRTSMLAAFQFPQNTQNVPTTTRFYLEVPHLSTVYPWYGAALPGDPPRQYFLRHSPTSGPRVAFWSSSHVGFTVSVQTDLETGEPFLLWHNGNGVMARYRSGSFSPWASSTWTKLPQPTHACPFPGTLTLIPVP